MTDKSNVILANIAMAHEYVTVTAKNGSTVSGFIKYYENQIEKVMFLLTRDINNQSDEVVITTKALIKTKKKAVNKERIVILRLDEILAVTSRFGVLSPDY